MKQTPSPSYLPYPLKVVVPLPSLPQLVCLARTNGKISQKPIF